MTQETSRALAVLVVEDDPAVAEVVVRYLERRGLVPVWAPSAEEALRVLAARPFDCVLLDNGLPGSMGIAALPEIAAKTKAPIIMMTGYPNEDVTEDARILGAKALLPKPLDLAELESRIRELASAT